MQEHNKSAVLTCHYIISTICLVSHPGDGVIQSKTQSWGLWKWL